MKREMNENQRGILRYLDTSENPLTKDNIKKHLEKQGYKPSMKEISTDLDYLIRIGYLGTNVERSGNETTESFYVTQWVGGGRRAQRRLLGRGAGSYVGGLWKRITGSIFLIFGLGFLFYQDTITTGNVVFESTAVALDIAFVLSFGLMIIGGILFYQSFRK